MTAHRPKPTLTPERIDWFARYYSQNQAWGVFHVCLDDGNYDCKAGPFHADPAVVAALRASWPADLRDAAEWFDKLTASQRRRLGQKAERRAMELGLVPMSRPGPRLTLTVTKADVENGKITMEASGE